MNGISKLITCTVLATTGAAQAPQCPTHQWMHVKLSANNMSKLGDYGPGDFHDKFTYLNRVNDIRKSSNLPPYLNYTEHSMNRNIDGFISSKKSPVDESVTGTIAVIGLLTFAAALK